MKRALAERASRSFFGISLVALMLLYGCSQGTSSSKNSAPTPAPTPAAIAVSVSPTTASVQVGQGKTLTATVTNDSSNKGVSWKLSGTGCSGATCGTLSATSSASGVAITYRAPASVPTPPTVTLTATSVTDSTKSAPATITVTAAPAAPAIVVTVSPMTPSVQAGAMQPFTATVQNDSQNEGVTWALSGTGCSLATCGTLSATSSASGVAITYTAPTGVPTPPTVTLTATSVTDGTKSGAATISVTVTVPGSLSVSLTPMVGGLTLGQTLSFTATVSNDVGAAGVTWSAGGNGCSGNTCGTFTVGTPNTSAIYTAPSTAGVYTITATSVANNTQSAIATIGVTDLSGVTTYHNDLSRDGVNAQEYALTTSNVTTSTFGKLFSCTADGAIYAQPLWVANVSIGGGTHNVIVAATMHDSVYVFDADANPCVTYWNMNLIPAGETYGSYADVGSADIYPDIGILGTPVVDPASSTVYVVTKTKNSGTTTYHQRVHALSLINGSEKFSGPVDITSAITVPGTGDDSSGGNVAFNVLTENQRPGLALVNGVVYVSWASHGDNDPYHGWIIGFSAGNLAQAPVLFNDSPNGGQGGIWMSGGAPSADSANNLYVISGNGSFDGTTDFGMSFMKLGTSGGITVADFFSPLNESSLSAGDQDFGSGGAAILVDQPGGPVPHLVIGGGKDENLFLLNRDGMGGFSSSTNNVVQTVPFGNGIFATAAFWQNTLYLAGSTTLKAFAFNTGSGQFNLTPSSQSTATYGFPGCSPSVSSSGTTNGIVWAMSTHAFGTSNSTVNSGGAAAGPTILHAYDATNLNTELWNSTQASGGRDTAGNAVKFTLPTVANGKVYIGTRGTDSSNGSGTIFGQINVYGLLPN